MKIFKNEFLINSTFVEKKNIDDSYLKFIENKKIPDNFDNDQPILIDFTEGKLENEILNAIEDDQSMRFNEFDKNFHETNDDAFVPIELKNSLINNNNDDENNENEDDDKNRSLEKISLRKFSLNNEEMKYLTLNRVENGEIPFGIEKEFYKEKEKEYLIKLYQRQKKSDRKELFEYLVKTIHRKYFNCFLNFQKWIFNPKFDQPIFYRNCVPCTNALDLNLQNLFDYHIQSDQLIHYYVNTCDMSTQWISYISNMEYLYLHMKSNSNLSFTDIIRQDLIPNQRYVIQGLIKTNSKLNSKEFLHVSNLIHDDFGQTWIIDGQIQRVFDFNSVHDINELNQKYRSDYISRAFTGIFRPLSFLN